MSDGACYLIWEAMDGGTISYVYAKTPPPTYMAKGSGGKPVPAHRFTGNGKTKLKNKCSVRISTGHNVHVFNIG